MTNHLICNECLKEWDGSTQFHCEKCHCSFENGWSNEEAEKEFKESFSTELHNAPYVVICDDCHQVFKEWRASLTYEQEKELERKGIEEHQNAKR